MAETDQERFFTLSPEMVIVAGFDGYWKRVNPSVEAILGFTEPEALARPFMEFVHPDDRERSEQEARRVVGGEPAHGFENRILCKDGSYKWIEWTVMPVPEEQVMWGIGRDVTERRRRESEETALRRLATMVAETQQPQNLFAVVAEEVARVFEVPVVSVVRYEADDTATEVATFSPDGPAPPTGRRWSLEGTNVLRRVRSNREVARIDDYSALEGDVAAAARQAGLRSTIGAPIVVAGEVWGAMVVSSRDEPLPESTVARLAAFTELLATAIGSSESRDALTRLVDEQVSLRRVATLVAQDVPANELFGAVTREVGALLAADFSGLGRFEGDSIIVVASSDEELVPIGARWGVDEAGVLAEVHRTGRSARIDGVDWSTVGGTIGEMGRRVGSVSTVASPIVLAGKLWGALSVSSARGRLPIDTEERLEKFADLVATAIANADSREALARLANEQAALRRVATLVARDASSNEVFEAVATEVGKLFDTDITIVGRYDDDGMATSIGNWSASPGGVPVGTRSPIGGRNVLTMVAETGNPSRMDGYEEGSGEAAEIARRHGWRSSIAAPIVVEGRLWGVMLVATQRPDPFPIGAEERLAAFTDLVATAVANAQAHDEVLRFGDEQAALGRVATLVAGGAAPERVFTAVVDEVASLIGLERIELVRYDGDTTGTVIAASGDHPFPAGSSWSLDDPSVMATVARTTQVARIDDYSHLPGEIARTAHGAGFRSAIGAPITVEGRLWGVIIAISTDPEPIPESSEARLSQFTELVATAVANADARRALERVAGEQTTLRRIATLVAEGLEPHEIFGAVIEEVGRLFDTDLTAVGRFDDDPPAFVAVALGSGMQGVEIGRRWAFDDPSAAASVFQSGRSVRVNERLRERSAALADTLVRLGVASTVSGPIVVEGHLWGAVLISSKEELAADTEGRLDKFAELIATAIANAESKAELAASRRRIVAASDETRRQIERDLHDGTQQRLVSLGLAVRAVEADVPPDRIDLRAELSGVAVGLATAVEELQELSRGIHPAILSKGGVGPALQTLAHRSPIPVDLDITTDMRLAEPIEVAAYFVASEALANAAKYSEASRIDVSLAQRDGRLVLSVRDDGVGGADAGRGSGLIGLNDRVEALGGSIHVSSPPGEGTQITAELPLELEAPQIDG